MAYEDLGKCVTVLAGEDLSSKQYCFVELNSSGQAVASGDGEDAIGILQNDPASGAAAVVMVGVGVSKLKAGASATMGDYVASDSAGRGVAVITGDRRLGQFLESPSAANSVVAFLFQKLGATA